MEGSDYNSIVYAWFEKSGIISNIRTQLRQNLVNVLKGTDMTLKKVSTAPKSAKQYVYDLLIAEYLWNHNYAYTLSIFASEAPLLVNFCNNVCQSNKTTNTNDKPKLQTDYVLHTLETLGINPENSDGQLIISEYKKNDVPLILTILKCICHLLNPRFERTDKFSDKFTQNSETQTDAISHNILLEKNKIIAARKKLLRQKDVYNKQLKDREIELNKRATKIEEQMVILNEKLTQTQIMMEEVNIKERKLIEKKKELFQMSEKKFILNRERSPIQTTQSYISEREQDSQIFRTDVKKIQEELAKVQEELFNKNKNIDLMIKGNGRDIGTQTELQEDDNGIQKSNETFELQHLVQKQQSRIEELTLRAIRLTRQLEESQLIKSSTLEIIKPTIRIPKTDIVLSENSSTDEIIQDAKQRIQRLKEEGLKADQSYFKCITNLPL